MAGIRLDAVTTSFFGYGCIDNVPFEMKKQGAKRALIVTDNFLYESGVADKVGQSLLKGDIEYAVFYLVSPNPSVEVINDCRNAAEALGVDWLVAVGGGSSIDTAKAVSILLANGGKIEDYEGNEKSSKPGIPIVAVSTTAGTGSEVTTFYIVTDPVKHSKMVMADTNCRIAIAVNDTQFMTTMPKGLTAATGMDAITHAIEAVQCKGANPLTDKDALWAIRTIKDYLPQAIETPQNVKARDMMSYAQYIAGMAFSNSGIGMVHAMAHSLGGFYNLPHGICNAVLLPFVMEFNATHANLECQFREIAKALEITGSERMSYAQVSKACVEYIKDLSKKVGITQSLKDLKVQEKDFEALTKLALNDICMQSNPVMPTLQQVIDTYKAAYFQ